MHVTLFFDVLSIGELLTFKTGPPCITNQNDFYGKEELFLLTTFNCY